jgi:hypothetical protein
MLRADGKQENDGADLETYDHPEAEPFCISGKFSGASDTHNATSDGDEYKPANPDNER